MRITPLGLREVIIATLLAWTGCALLGWAALEFSPLLWIPADLLLLCWGWVLWFFRDPQRNVPPGQDANGWFLSPADGRISDVTPVGPDSPLGCEGVRIGIFMSIFDVHVNRIPCDGRVDEVTHREGCFLDARDPAASERNESATIRMTHVHDGREFPVVVRQIAGLIARRIITRLEIGQAVTRGRRFGMIKFGSRLELFLPRELAGDIRVRPGRRVLAGLSVLASAGPDEKENTDG